MTKRVRVLAVDGRATPLWPLNAILAADSRVDVVGCVDDGNSALAFLQRERVDVVVMDLGDDRYEATRRIMETRPVPIVLCSRAAEPGEVANVFKSLEAGAVAVVARPASPDDPAYARVASELRRMTVLMSEVKVVRRWPRRGRSALPPVEPGCGSGVVGIGASTGGPPALQAILAALPKDFALPILIVQHISKGFLPGLAAWLDQTTALNVQIAANGLRPMPGHAYLAPDDFHLELDAAGRIRLVHDARDNTLCPSIDRMFRSIATHCGAHATGVLLTGMGRDGAAELKTLRECGAHTIAQDRDTSVVHGMPGVAIGLGAATEILPIDGIAEALRRMARQHEANTR